MRLMNPIVIGAFGSERQRKTNQKNEFKKGSSQFSPNH